MAKPISEGQEKREMLALACENVAGGMQPNVAERPQLLAAAAELRKTCATCRSFKPTSLSGKAMACTTWRYSVPADGSGFCHRWEAKL